MKAWAPNGYDVVDWPQPRWAYAKNGGRMLVPQD